MSLCRSHGRSLAIIVIWEIATIAQKGRERARENERESSLTNYGCRGGCGCKRRVSCRLTGKSDWLCFAGRAEKRNDEDSVQRTGEDARLNDRERRNAARKTLSRGWDGGWTRKTEAWKERSSAETEFGPQNEKTTSARPSLLSFYVIRKPLQSPSSSSSPFVRRFHSTRRSFRPRELPEWPQEK